MGAFLDPCSQMSNSTIRCYPVRACTLNALQKGTKETHELSAACVCQTMQIDCVYDASPCDSNDPYTPLVALPGEDHLVAALSSAEVNDNNSPVLIVGSVCRVIFFSGILLLACALTRHLAEAKRSSTTRPSESYLSL